MGPGLRTIREARQSAADRRFPPIPNSQSLIRNPSGSSSVPGAVASPAGRPRGLDDGSSTVGPAREATVCSRAGVCDAGARDDGARDLVEQAVRRRMTDIRRELGYLAGQIKTYDCDRWPLIAVQAFVRDCDDRLSLIRKRVADAINEYPPVVLGPRGLDEIDLR